MKAILEFRLPEEEADFYYAKNGSLMAVALSELDNRIRAKLKYGEMNSEKREAYEEIRSILFELTEDLDYRK